MSNALKTASVLAFERKLDPSDAVFHAGNWEDLAKSASWPPVRLRENPCAAPSPTASRPRTRIPPSSTPR